MDSLLCFIRFHFVLFHSWLTKVAEGGDKTKMKVAIKITNFTPDRESYRTETFKEPTIEKVSKKEQTTSANKGERLMAQVIEIKRAEPVYEFPKGKNLESYLKAKVQVKLMGCLAVIRKFFDYQVTPDAGGVKGLKDAFDTAWNVRVLEIKDVGDIVPIGFTRRFQYKGQSGGMGENHFDLLTMFTAVVDITNPPIENLAKNIFQKAIDYLECTKLGRSGQIEIIK